MNSSLSISSLKLSFCLLAIRKPISAIELKSKYVREKGLKGIMFWQLMNDKKSDGLLSEMVQSIKSN